MDEDLHERVTNALARAQGMTRYFQSQCPTETFPSQSSCAVAYTNTSTSTPALESPTNSAFASTSTSTSTAAPPSTCDCACPNELSEGSAGPPRQDAQQVYQDWEVEFGNEDEVDSTTNVPSHLLDNQSRYSHAPEDSHLLCSQEQRRRTRDSIEVNNEIPVEENNEEDDAPDDETSSRDSFDDNILNNIFCNLLRLHIEGNSRNESGSSDTSHEHLEEEEEEEGEEEEEMMEREMQEHLRTHALLSERQSVVGELAMLQQEQCDTVRELLRLRVEQLQLRIQQLSALSCLLDSERLLFLAAPTQLSAVQHVIDLLTSSLRELLREPSIAAQQSSMHSDHAAAAAALSASMSAVDSRADQIANMARTLLETLHASPWRMSGLEALRQRHMEIFSSSLAEALGDKGASEEQITSLPTCTYSTENPSNDDRCPICLDAFKNGDLLRKLGCMHQHHQICLDHWLSIRNCCSLCLEIAVKEVVTPVS